MEVLRVRLHLETEKKDTSRNVYHRKSQIVEKLIFHDFRIFEIFEFRIVSLLLVQTDRRSYRSFVYPFSVPDTERLR